MLQASVKLIRNRSHMHSVTDW